MGVFTYLCHHLIKTTLLKVMTMDYSNSWHIYFPNLSFRLVAIDFHYAIWVPWIRETKKKVYFFFRHNTANFLKRMKICVYLPEKWNFKRSQNVSRNIKRIKNTIYIERYFEFDTIILAFIKKMLLYHIQRKNAFCLKRGVLLDLKISYFGLNRCGFFRPESAKTGCFSNTGTSMDIRFGREVRGDECSLNYLYSARCFRRQN